MSTMRVHLDQENRAVAEVLRAKEKSSMPLQPLQQQTNKRAVLGLLHSNCQRSNKNVSNKNYFHFILLF